jgi:hypothetical protein
LRFARPRSAIDSLDFFALARTLRPLASFDFFAVRPLRPLQSFDFCTLLGRCGLLGRSISALCSAAAAS